MHLSNLSCLPTTEQPLSWVSQEEVCHTLTMAFFMEAQITRGGKTKPPFPAPTLTSTPLCCNQVWLKWKSESNLEIPLAWYDKWVDLNDASEFKTFSSVFRNVSNTPQIEDVISRYFTCYRRVCDDECDCHEDNACCENAATNSTLAYSLALAGAIVVERIEYNKKKRNLVNNHGEAIGLVAAVLMLMILDGDPSPEVLMMGLIVFVGMTLISRRKETRYNLLSSTAPTSRSSLTI